MRAKVIVKFTTNTLLSDVFIDIFEITGAPSSMKLSCRALRQNTVIFIRSILNEILFRDFTEENSYNDCQEIRWISCIAVTVFKKETKTNIIMFLATNVSHYYYGTSILTDMRNSEIFITV